MIDHEVITDRIAVYKDDFLKSEDVSKYAIGKSLPPFVKIKGKYYALPTANEYGEEFDEELVPDYVERIPLSLYTFWQRLDAMFKQGLAILCVNGVWYMAVCADDAFTMQPPSNPSFDRDEYRIEALKELCKSAKYGGCRFLYSAHTDENKARLWCLLPKQKCSQASLWLDAKLDMQMILCEKPKPAEELKEVFSLICA